MFKSILKISLRNLFKNRTYTIISITGLALAIGCFIVAFVFVDYFHNIDRFHENIDNIYYIEIEITRNGVSQTWGPTPVPLGPALL